MRKSSGFTLIELMVVIGIIAVFATIAIPNYIGWLPKYRLGSAARDLLSAMQHARLTAVNKNVDVRMVFYPDQNNYRIFSDYNGDKVQDADEPTLKSGNMPGGVDLKETNFSSNSFNFDGRGLASGSGGTISLENTLKNQARVRVNHTGNSRILVEE